MTKFTKEQLIDQAQKNIAVLRGAVERIPGASEAAVIHLRLAEITLATLTAEPVGEVVLGEYDDSGCHPDARVVCIAADGQADWENFKDGTRLYAAPSAPVVPDIGEIRVGRLPTMNQDDYPGLGDWWVQLRIGKDSDEVLARVYGATPQEANNRAEALACRAAMLQGVEPVKEWIPCRDRMPEKMVSILATGDWFDYAVTAWDGGSWLNFDYESPVTHWMPLPAAPQQEM